MMYDICVIGGGAAGLAAAASFNKELKVCILEKNDRLGRKIAATGGGRCNLTNEACENSKQVLDFFRSLGLETFADEEGRYYPYSERAADVVETLESALGDNVTVRCGVEVQSISCVTGEAGSEGGFVVSVNDKSHVSGSEVASASDSVEIEAARVLIAMGGKAAPQYGTTGDGYGLAKNLGHKVTKVFPILSGIKCSAEGVDFRELKGIRAKGALTLYKKEMGSCTEERALACELGEIQFTEDGISGICVFNLTPFITADEGEKPADAMKKYSISVDLAPFLSDEEVAGRSTSFGIVTGKLAEVVKPSQLKNWKLQIEGVKGWKNAQATSGGVSLDEINMETMESRIIEGLYFAGEIIDIQGPCGGFNLQNAWETGIRAAKAINADSEMK